MSEILVSFIIPTIRGLNYCEKVISDIAKINRRDIEIIVINDNPAIKIESEIERTEIAQSISNNFTIRCIDNNVNIGPGGSRNIWINYALGSYVAFVDDDDRINSNFFNHISVKSFKDADIVLLDFEDSISALSNSKFLLSLNEGVAIDSVKIIDIIHL